MGTPRIDTRQSADSNGYSIQVEAMAHTATTLAAGPRHGRLSGDMDEQRIARQSKVPAGGSSLVSLSILMPVYNEERTILEAISSVLRADLPCESELIVIDDGSSDGTSDILSLLGHPKLTIITHATNRGKGAALTTGAAAAVGTHVVPFDSDLEYDPSDLAAMLRPILQGRSHVVYGTRMFGVNTRYQSYRHAMGNRALTFAANILFDAYISDMHTCLKLVPASLFRQLRLAESGFALDTELTAKILRMGLRPFEVPVTYHSRSTAQGKKLTSRAGVECLRVMARVRRGRAIALGIDDYSPTLQAVLDPFAEAMNQICETP
jgi:dolichol-phosphate hexosyltransferase